MTRPVRLFALPLVLVLALPALVGCGGSSGGMDMSSLGLNSDLSGILGNLTGILGGITSLSDAQNALPDLNGLNADLGDLVGKAAQASPEQQQQLARTASEAMPRLEGLTDTVTSIPGVANLLKPTLDSIMSKVSGLM
ncbi:hypothetical protein GF314_04050 [bacterium]|nr:hypothetical protein [bacterium]